MNSQARLLLVVVALLVALGCVALLFFDESEALPEQALEQSAIAEGSKAFEGEATREAAGAEAQLTVATPTPSGAESERVAGLAKKSSGELSVRGRVVDARGDPIFGAQVHVRENEDPEFVIADYDPFQGSRETNAEGEFHVRVGHQGQYAVLAKLGERRSNEVVLVDLNPRHPEESVELTIGAPQVIEGLVLHRNQRPASRALVFAFVDVERQGIELPSGFDSVELFGQSMAVAGADGSFRFEFAADDRARYTVRAEMPRVHSNSRGETHLSRSQRWAGEVSDVRPGTAPLTLTLGPPAPFPPSIRLAFTAQDGGSLPKTLRYRLQRLGPHGGVYQERVSTRAVLQESELVIPQVIGGARYELRLEETGLSQPVTVGPFVAEEGETLQRVDMPGLFDGTFRFEDPHGRLSEGFVLELIRIDETGVRHRIANRRYDKSFPEVTLALPAGELHAEVRGVLRGGAGRKEPLLTRAIEMRPRATVFDIAVP